MANDRVFIKCEGCGASTMFLKHYPGMLGPMDDDDALETMKWVEDHCQCNPNYWSSDLGGITGFSLHTEDEFKEGGQMDFSKMNLPSPKNVE